MGGERGKAEGLGSREDLYTAVAVLAASTLCG